MDYRPEVRAGNAAILDHSREVRTGNAAILPDSRTAHVLSVLISGGDYLADSPGAVAGIDLLRLFSTSVYYLVLTCLVSLPWISAAGCHSDTIHLYFADLSLLRYCYCNGTYQSMDAILFLSSI